MGFRLGGVSCCLFVVSEEELMQIPDEILKCVAFLACKRNSGYVSGGTVFFVGYPNTADDGVVAPYAVTARHVIEEIGNRGDGNAYCRLNTRQGGVTFLPVPISSWVFNDDLRIDVAAAPIPLNSETCDHKVLPLTTFITSDIISRYELGIGDDLFFPGLFTQRPGEDRNLPIVRIGNIAAMPEEPVQTQWGVLRPPYLVEARSLGGLSGSPVFWNHGSVRMSSGTLAVAGGSAPFFLLGLIHGHYEERGGTWGANGSAAIDGANTVSANMGIAIVIPAHDILSTLNHPDLEHQRNVEFQRRSAMKNLSLPIPDVGIASHAEMNWVTQEDTMSPITLLDPMGGPGDADVLSDSTEGHNPPAP
jgi:hypothetical protein